MINKEEYMEALEIVKKFETEQKTVNVELTIVTKKPLTDIHNAIIKGIVKGLDVSNIASPTNVEISFK